MDLKSKCNHYRWESLDVTESSYLESLSLSWLLDALSCVTSPFTTGDRLQTKQTFFVCGDIRSEAHVGLVFTGFLGHESLLCVTSLCSFSLYKIHASCFQRVLFNSSSVALKIGPRFRVTEASNPAAPASSRSGPSPWASVGLQTCG